MNLQISKQAEEWFLGCSETIADWTSSAWAIALSLLVLLLWVIGGVKFGYNDTWIHVDRIATVVPFVVVFAIQITQKKNQRALQLKLDEIIRAIKEARNEFIDLEEQSDDVIEELASELKQS